VEHDWAAASVHVFPVLRPEGTHGTMLAEVDSDALAAEGLKKHALPLVDPGPAGLAVAYALRSAAYDVLVPWWSSVVSGTGVQLYIGQATYKISTWGDPEEMPRHLVLNRSHAVAGDIHYSIKELLANPLGFADRLRTDFYRNPALVPTSPRLIGPAPGMPTGVTAVRTANGIEVSWTAPTGTAPTYYAVYRADGSGCGIDAGRNLLATRRAGSGVQRFTDTAPPPIGQVTYLVTALSRLHYESVPASGTLF
jgi:hypothetical protein